MEIKKEQLKLIIDIIEEYKNILYNEYSDVLDTEEESILKSLKEQLALTDVVLQSEQLMQSCRVCGMHKHPVLGAHCKANNCPNEH
jgi:hypothetical protein